MSHHGPTSVSGLETVDSEVGALLSEFTTRVQAGESLELHDFAAQHPQHFDELKRLLPTARTLARLRSAMVTHPDPLATIGDFRLLREIGRGGMGIVYEAEQISLGRRVALKVLPFAGVLDERRLQRFRNEARAAASLQHPNIVPVHAVGSERGVHYYAMNFIDGCTLAEVIAQLRQGRDGPAEHGGHTPPCSPGGETCSPRAVSTANEQSRIDVSQIVRWMIDVAEALEHAHSVGVIHRDIKPANLLVDSRGHIWVADFGLVQIESEASMTRTGDILGTLRYASPEQALGHHNLVDQRTDVYSLGMTLYELLALVPAFAETNQAELLRKIEFDNPPPLKRYRPRIPVELGTIIYKAIEKHPAQRYPTARHLADDLRRFLNRQPIRARRPTWRGRAARWMWRHRVLVGSVCVAAVLCCVVGVIATGLVWHARQQTELERIGRQADAKATAAVQKVALDHRYVDQVNQADSKLRHGEFAEAFHCLEEFQADAECRGFEWHYLSRQTAGAPRAIGEHGGTVYKVQVSPDGRWLASCGQDGIRIWNLITNELKCTLTAHLSEVNRVCFSPDGRLMASTSDDGTALIWNTQFWSVIATLQHTGPAAAGSFSRDGRWLYTGEYRTGIRRGDAIPDALKHIFASGSPSTTPEFELIGENLVRAWDTEAWVPRVVLRRHDDRLTAGALDHRGSRLVTGDGEGTVNIWRVPEGTLERTVFHAPEPEWARGVGDMDLANHHPWMVTAGASSVVRLWNIDDGSLAETLHTDHGGTRSVVFSPDDTCVVTAGRERGTDRGLIQIWKRSRQGYQRAGALRHPSQVWSVGFVNHAEIAFGDHTGGVYRWQLPDQSDTQRFRDDEPGTIAHAAISPDGRWLARSGSRLVVQSLEEPGRTITLEAGSVSDSPLAFAPDGTALAAARGSVLSLWGTGDWRHWTSMPPEYQILGIKFHGGSGRICAATAGERTRWWDFQSRRPLPIRGLPDLHPFETTVSSRTNLIFVRSEPHESNLWELRAGDNVRWRRRLAEVSLTKLSPDETRIAAAMTNGHIEIIDVQTGAAVSECLGGNELVEGLAFSPDSRTLVSYSQHEQQVTFWHVRTGRKLLTIQPGFKTIRTLEFSSDGQWLVIAGQGLSTHAEVLLLHGRMR